MLPLRILLVEDAPPVLQDLRAALDNSSGFEVCCATSCPAGMLTLARRQPDLLVLNPYAGRGTVEAWRRAVRRFRASRQLSVIALARRVSSRDRAGLRELADLGIYSPRTEAWRIQAVLEGWANSEKLLAGAACDEGR